MALRIRAAVSAALAATRQPVNTNFVMGRCLPSTKQNAAKIRVSQLHLDPRINMVSEWKCATTVTDSMEIIDSQNLSSHIKTVL